MSNRLYTSVVVATWLAAMIWLLTDRILPPFYGGDAPETRLSRQADPTGWRIEWEGKPCGEAVMQVVDGDAGAREAHSYLCLDLDSPPKSAPVWIGSAIESLRDLSFEMRTVTTIDPLGNLAAFDTRVHVNHIETPVRIRGRVELDSLKLSIRVGDLRRSLEHSWPSNGVLGAELTPITHLLPLHQGRKWRQESFSPFASPQAPLELIEAEVTQPLKIEDGEGVVDGWLVEYRSLEKTGRSQQGRLRAKMYVARDGRVLKRETFLMGNRLEFTRMSPQESLDFAAEKLELARHAALGVPSAEREASNGRENHSDAVTGVPTDAP